MKRGRCAPGALLFVLCTPVAGLEQISLHVQDIAGPGFHAQGITLDLAVKDARTVALTLRAASLTLPPPAGLLRDVRLHCPVLRLEKNAARCDVAEIRLPAPLLDQPVFRGAFRYRLDTQQWVADLTQVHIGGGLWSVHAEAAAPHWRLAASGHGINLARLSAQLGPYVELPPHWTYAGRLDLDAVAAGTDQTLTSWRVHGSADKLGYSNPDGANAAEDLAFTFMAQLARQQNGWTGKGGLTLTRGTLCAGPCWELRGAPLTLDTGLSWQGTSVALAPLRISQGLAVAASAKIALSTEPPQIERAEVNFAPSDLATLYRNYVEPLVVGTALAGLKATGQISGSARYTRNADPELALTLRDASITQADGRAALQNLRGDLHWGSTPRVSEFRWDSGQVLQIPLGAAHLRLENGAEGGVRLATPTAIPLFDGALKVQTLDMRPTEHGPAWRVDATLTPLSMKAFSRAMGWPEMRGQLSGMIPELRYADGILTLGGTLLVNAFDGAITVRGLRIDRLLGTAPTLNAELAIDNIDLDALTRTFAFGNITGRLSGRMQALTLQNWQPVSFDAWFVTPKGDRSRHRISQRAVDNIANLGGSGVSGAVSRSFLRAFDEFSYARLGVSCKLARGVCAMGGVAPAPGGYYLVQGGGLPRISIVGYNTRVDWDTLLARLKRITEGSSPQRSP